MKLILSLARATTRRKRKKNYRGQGARGTELCVCRKSCWLACEQLFISWLIRWNSKANGKQLQALIQWTRWQPTKTPFIIIDSDSVLIVIIIHLGGKYKFYWISFVLVRDLNCRSKFNEWIWIDVNLQLKSAMMNWHRCHLFRRLIYVICHWCNSFQ